MWQQTHHRRETEAALKEGAKNEQVTQPENGSENNTMRNDGVSVMNLSD